MPRKSKEELKNKILNLLNVENKNVSENQKSKVELSAKASESENFQELKTDKKTTNKVPVKSTTTKEANKNLKDTSVELDSKVKSTSSKSRSTTKSTNKKASSNGTTKSKATTKKTSRKTNSKSSSNSHSKKSVKNVNATVEYYDLPYRYNETIVKILAQTPNMLFIYWDISDDDRNSYIKKYGEDFFNITKPVLLVTNKTMNYSFEVEINDFANSWYLHISDADCDYEVELGRRPIECNSNVVNYIHITTSNDMQMPNDHILFDKLGKSIFFKNIKNNFVEEKDVSSLTFIKSLGKVYDAYELYEKMYNGEINIDDLKTGNLKLNLSSSNSSTFK